MIFTPEQFINKLEYINQTVGGGFKLDLMLSACKEFEDYCVREGVRL
jgi:hypothetical protein